MSTSVKDPLCLDNFHVKVSHILQFLKIVQIESVTETDISLQTVVNNIRLQFEW